MKDFQGLETGYQHRLAGVYQVYAVLALLWAFVEQCLSYFCFIELPPLQQKAPTIRLSVSGHGVFSFASDAVLPQTTG
jgi:hypothetical protein